MGYYKFLVLEKISAARHAKPFPPIIHFPIMRNLHMYNATSNATSNRRDFLKATAGIAAGTAATIVPRHVLGGVGGKPPSEKLNLAGVGIGGVGHGQLQCCDSTGFNIVALCDVDDVYAKKSYDKWPQARRYRDFREMFDAESDKIDAVYCGTPDHTHAIITLAALKKKNTSVVSSR